MAATFDHEEYAENWCRACDLETCPGRDKCTDLAYAWSVMEDEAPTVDFTYAPPPAFQETCGMCGKPLDECHIGPCPWGSPERPVLIVIGEYSDQVPCAIDTGEATSCADCPSRDICRDKDVIPY